MQVGDCLLGVIVDGHELPVTAGEGYYWITARKGTAFSLLFGNRGASRVLAIPSIDGLSAVDGQPASYKSPGYLIRPGSELLVPGWRIDNESVARFEFAGAVQGYASQMGHSQQNVGVIGAAFFHEKVLPVEELRRVLADDARAARQFQVGNAYAPHAFVERTADLHMTIWERGSELELPEAVWFISVCKLLGIHVNRDVPSAVASLERMASWGVDLAEYTLALHYENTKRSDLVIKSYHLLGRAAKQCLPAAVVKLRRTRNPNEEPFEVRFSFSSDRPTTSTSGRRQPVSTATSTSRPHVEPSVMDDLPSTDDVSVAFGRKAEHQVRQISFERAAEKTEVVISIRYDTDWGLRQRGIGCRIPDGWRG